MPNKDTFLSKIRPAPSWLKLAKLGSGALLTATLLGGGYAWSQHGRSDTQYVTEPVGRGDIALKVSATGTLSPTNSVDVGSELSGTIAAVLVDYNDRVKKGQVLAELDTTKLRQQIAKSQAALKAAEASIAQNRATVAETGATVKRYEEVSRLSGGKVPAPTEMDAARAKLARAQADLDSALAAVAEARASLQSNETDLAKSTIRAPIDGVVLSRAVSKGQTVAASLSVTTLFTLAEDLKKMELVVSVAESDVGQVRAGQAAEFNVDAHPDKPFPATIKLVRVASKTVDNVVSYQTVLAVDNQDLALLPGMTATADILAAEKKGVLRVPNAALRFEPGAAPSAKPGGGVLSFLMPRPPMPAQAPRTASAPAKAGSSKGAARVWIDSPTGPRAVTVQTGLSDGKYTEIESGEIKEGDAVITDTASVKKPS
ncbi:HlyD family secretion protein [Formivibrio citricus]|uniref:HlyD family secretion protein n=1 Tax=Formivibrio citricus TaxID=83765 RepID=A0A1I5A3H1_9NEIS|nr:efflux RND transporter periplasmic adaptor subunit [Formivibrio citricus]SFN56870.1 HlyD family secretion protein [Formivibrio citricus]